MRRGSISVTLFRNTVVLTIVIILGIALLAFRSARREIDTHYDAQLITGANVLRALMRDELHERATAPAQLDVPDDLLSAEDKDAFNAYAEWRMFRVWRRGALMLSSDTGPADAKPPPAPGFRDQEQDGQSWRIYSLAAPRDGVIIEVGEQHRIRQELIERIELDLIGPLALLVPISAALLWLGIQGGLDALRDLIGQIGHRSERDLSRLDPARWPRDLNELVEAINRLLARLGLAFEREQRFTDQAAHQLRTPLAVIKLQAQTALRETDLEERDRLIARIPAGVDRATLLVAQLLLLARVQTGDLASLEIDLCVEIDDLLSQVGPLAQAGGGAVVRAGVETAPWLGDPTLVRLALLNLIENAIKHAGVGFSAVVEVTPSGEGWRIRVLDDGPGIAAEDRERMFERFQRSSEATEGVGLGLSLVWEAAQRLGGSVRLETGPDGKGLCAVVTLPKRRAFPA